VEGKVGRKLMITYLLSTFDSNEIWKSKYFVVGWEEVGGLCCF